MSGDLANLVWACMLVAALCGVLGAALYGWAVDLAEWLCECALDWRDARYVRALNARGRVQSGRVTLEALCGMALVCGALLAACAAPSAHNTLTGADHWWDRVHAGKRLWEN